MQLYYTEFPYFAGGYGYCSLHCKIQQFRDQRYAMQCTQNAKIAFWRCNSPVFCDFRFASLTKNTSCMSPVNSNRVCSCSLRSQKRGFSKNPLAYFDGVCQWSFFNFFTNYAFYYFSPKHLFKIFLNFFHFYVDNVHNFVYKSIFRSLPFLKLWISFFI